MAPNVVVIVLDAARRDALEPYGAPVGSTLAVAQLARRGIARDGVYATSCWTVPSHASIFTGLMPRKAGLSRVPSPEAAKPVVHSHRARLLSEVMRGAGYRTAGASANVWIAPATGLDEGFDDFAEVRGDRNARIHETSLRARLAWLAEAARAEADDGAEQIAAALRGWADDRQRRPFFWFVNLLECHSPYLPPAPYADVSRLQRLRAAQDARKHYTLAAFWRTCAGVEHVPDSTMRRLRRNYLASIRAMDDWLARLLEHLDSVGALDETLVVVLSDHGENLGEDGLIGHGLSLDDRLTHVPFVAAGPGAETLSLASLADLPRVLAEAAGISEHPYTDGPPPGFGLSQFDPPVTADDEEGREGLAGMGIVGEAHARFTTPLTSVVADGLKIVQRGGAEEIYDLTVDPGERQSLAAEDPTLAGRQAELGRLRAVFDHPCMETVSPQAARAAPVSDQERADLEDRMRLLGYL